jgi:hypothetical protein
MGMQFTRNGKKAECNKRMVFFAIVFFSSLMAKAQVPVGDEFSGQWFFDHAETQEKPGDSRQDYTKRAVSLDDFNLQGYLQEVPTQVNFMGPFMAHISHLSWAKGAFAVINTGSNMLEFREMPREKSDEEGLNPTLLDSYPVMVQFSNLKLSGNTMSMQYNYSIGKEVEGILTIYYKQ